MSARSRYPLVAVLENVLGERLLNRKDLRELVKRARKGSKQHRIEDTLKLIDVSWYQYQYLYGCWLRKGGKVIDFLLALTLSLSLVGVLVGGEFLTTFMDVHMSEESGRLYWEVKKDEISKSFLFVKQIDALCKEVHDEFVGYELNIKHDDVQLPDQDEFLGDWVFEKINADGVLVGYSKLDTQLRKWDFGNNKKLVVPKNIVGTKWADLLTRYVKMVPKEIRSVLTRHLRLLFPPSCRVAYHEKAILQSFKSLSTKLKKHVPHCISGIAGYLIDLGQLGGYDTVDNRGNSIFQEWREAMEKTMGVYDKVKGSNVYNGLQNEIRKVVREWGINSQRICQPVDFEQFIADRGNWAISGASTLPKKSVTVKSVDARRGYVPQRVQMATKEMTAMFYSDEELVKMALDPEGGLVSYPFRKGDEPAKARVVVNHAIESYFRVSFLDHYIAKPPDYTTLEKGTRATRDMYYKMQSLLKAGNWGISLDYSGWDTSVFVSLVECVVDEFSKNISQRLCERGDAVSDYIGRQIETVGKLEKESLRNMWYQFPTGDRVWGGNGFLSSGYKWTAVANTIINRALFNYTIKCMGDRRVTFSAHQGDDVAVLYRAETKHEAESFVARFSNFVSKLGFDINPSKTSIDENGVEFLRLWVTQSGVWGYPGRMARTFFWSKPQDTGGEYQSWLNRVQETVENGKIALRRGLSDVGPVVRRIVNKFIPRQLSVQDRSRLVHWLSCSENRGGMGAPGFWDRENNKSAMWFPVLKQNIQVYLPAKLRQELGSGLDHKTGGILATRLRELLTDNIPLKGVSRKLVFIRRPSIQRTNGIYRKVSQILTTGKSFESIPMMWPTVEDGPGWWVGSVLGPELLRVSRRGDDSWVFYLSDRFKEVLEKYRVRPTKGLVNWGETNRQPPPVNKKPEELSQWEERLACEQRWNTVFTYGILFATHEERKIIEAGS